MRQLLSYYILIIFIGAGLVNGGAIVEIITKTADVHDAGCDCGLEIAILTPKVRMKRTHFCGRNKAVANNRIASEHQKEIMFCLDNRQ